MNILNRVINCRFISPCTRNTLIFSIENYHVTYNAKRCIQCINGERNEKYRQYLKYDILIHASMYFSTDAISTSTTLNSNNKPIQRVSNPSKPQVSKRKKKSKVDAELTEELNKIDKEYDQIKSALQAIFPYPKNNLHNAYAIISSELGTKHNVTFDYRQVCQAPSCWDCTTRVLWPSEAHFTCRAGAKGEAANRAALLMLQWLQSVGKINRKGEVELMVSIKKTASKQAPVAEIHLGAENLDKVEQIVNRYYDDVVKTIQGSVKTMEPSYSNGTLEDAAENLSVGDTSEDFDFDIDTLPIKRSKRLYPHVADRRDNELFQRYERVKDRRDGLSAALPIDKFKEEIIELVNNHNVVVIKGEPGCGKSTQVPQYLLEWHAARKKGTDCNIVVTQPRRISAISLAERVAFERNEQVGDVVGYHVRLYAKHPRYHDGYIMFCSTGMLVRKMIGDYGLSGVSHVIVDEAHERDTPVDFLLLLLKRALEINPALKVIIMSATINAELFSVYFNNCPTISIPGFTYPVEHHFLDGNMYNMLARRGVKFEDESVKNPSVNIEAVVETVRWIDETKPDGAILVFLPGWFEIRTAMDEISSSRGANNFIVVPAHSKLSNEDQKKMFDKPNDGRRKVILSTNLAETSLTINDVVYVVDSGAVKEERMDLKTGLVCLDNQWASQANIRQRRGRAGRVQPGESYHLFTQHRFDTLDPFPIPEINRIPLTRSVLDVKMYAKDENIAQFLSCLPEPPRPESVAQAVAVLEEMGALDPDENLTPLGKRIYKLPLDPYLSKALVHACLLKCVSPMLSIVTLLSADYTIFENTLGLKSSIRKLKQQYSPGSDHIALARLYHDFESIESSNPAAARDDCMQKGIVYRSMDRTRKLRGLHSDLLRVARLVPDTENVNDELSPSNHFSLYDELVKSVLLSGLGKILISQKAVHKRALNTRTMDGCPAVIGSESVNSKFKVLPVPLLTYFKSLSSTERRAVIVHETSLLSPLSVVLFLPGVVTLKSMDGLDPGQSVISIQNTKPINILVNQKEGEQLLHLRQVLWNVLEYLVEHEGQPVSGSSEQYQTMSQFRDDLLLLLATLASQQGANIDFTDSGELRTEPSSGRANTG